MKSRMLYALLGFLGVTIWAYANHGISNLLQQQIENVGPDGWVSVTVILQDQVVTSDLHSRVQGMNPQPRRHYVVDYLKRFTEKSQNHLTEFLIAKSRQGDVRRHTVLWICNGIILDLKAYLVDELWRTFPEIQSIDLNIPIPTEQLVDLGPPPDTDNLDEIAWGVQDIRAPEVWALGYIGQGVLIGHLDTGVDLTHPDLTDRIWVNPGEDLNGNGVIDSTEINNVDDDDNGYIDDFYGWNFGMNTNDVQDVGGHGTSTAGIVIGTGAGGQQTGVAPGATLMVLSIQGGWESSYWEAQQYALDNGAVALTSSTSFKWRFNPRPNYAIFRRACEVELAAGLVHANSIGNEGDNQNTDPIPFNVSTPGNCPSAWLHPDQSIIGGISSVIAVGAYSSGYIIEPYSSFGPSAWYLADILNLDPSYPYQATWPPEYDDYPYVNGTQIALLKPDVSAPTVVLTTQLGGGYRPDFWGTSASTPHVGGALCLMLSVDSTLTPQLCSQALQTTARENGAPGKDNRYGAGMVDAYEAVLSIIGDLGYVTGTVCDSLTDLPIVLAQINVLNTLISTTTDDSGHYELILLADSLFTIQATAFAHLSRQMEITVSPDDTLIVDFSLPLAPHGTLAGWVLDQYGHPIQGVGVSVVDTLMAPVPTDSMGYFMLHLPPDEVFTISIFAEGWQTVTDQVVVHNGQVLFRTYILEITTQGRPTGPDAFGYYAYDNLDISELAPRYNWIELDPNLGGSGTPIIITQSNQTQWFELPFAFTYYHETYDSVSVCDNGWIAMGLTTDTDQSNSAVPSYDGPPAMIAPFWEDFATQDDTTMFYAHIEQDHLWVVEWNNIPQFYPYSTFESFQVILRDPTYYPTPTGDGEILFQYDRITDPTQCTVGIEDHTETVGLELLFDDTYAPTTAQIVEGRAILLTTRYEMPDSGAVAGTVVLDGPGLVENAQIHAGNVFTNPSISGDYLLSGLPEGLVRITAGAYGYIDSSLWVEIVGGDTISGIDFTLEYLPTPSNLTGTLVDSIVNLIWEAADTSGHDIKTANPCKNRGLLDNRQCWELLGYLVYRNEQILDSTITDTTYQDFLTRPGTYQYYVRARFIRGISDSTNHSIIEYPPSGAGKYQQAIIPTEPYLSQNYPNPFNPITTIRYGLTEPGIVKILIYNILGREVVTLVNHVKPAGNYIAVWDGKSSQGLEVSSGIYFYRVEAINFVDANKMVLLK
jgi:subtilisin family serine protease